MNNKYIEYIEYKGRKITKKTYVAAPEKFYCKFGSNVFELEECDLKKMLEDIRKKAEELKLNGVDFKNLRYCFYANEDDDSYNQQFPLDAECEVFIGYDVLEDDKQSSQRIKEQKALIDRQIIEAERYEAAKKMVDKYNVEQAIQMLNKHGYNVTKNHEND